MKTPIVFLAALMAATSIAVGQTDTTATKPAADEMPLTLKEAVDNAMQYSKQLQASKMDIDLYKQKVKETMSAGLPQVSAQLGYTTYFGTELDFGGQAMKMEDAIALNASASYTLSLQQLTSVKISKIAKAAVEVQIESDILDVKANVIDTYYAVLVYRRNIEILKKNLADMEDIQRHTENMYAAGAVERTDVDQIRINVATLKNALISTERSFETTKRLLVLQMGLPIGTKIAPTNDLEDLIVDRTVTTLDSSRFDITQNVSYKALELSNQINEKTLKMQRWSYAPTLTAAYQYTNNLQGGFLSFDHVGSLTLNIPIFTGLQRHSLVEQAKIEVNRGEVNMALLKDNLEQNEEQYRYELNSAIDSYLLQKENLEVAQRILENYRNKYNQGALSSLDLTQANTNYLQAETSYASACLDLLMAHTQLSKLYNNFEY